jgi:hypothetical protein
MVVQVLLFLVVEPKIFGGRSDLKKVAEKHQMYFKILLLKF